MKICSGALVALALWLAPALLPAQQKPRLTNAQYRADFAFFWQTVADNYAYFDQKQTDWPNVRRLYQPQADTVATRRGFVRLLENVFTELYDNHASLFTNRPDSWRLVPSGSDLYAELVAGQARVLDVRPGYGAERAGLRPGMEIVAVNGVPVAEAIGPLLGRALRAPGPRLAPTR